ncbi:hypothetical protein NDU88_001570 [Pleurodeles waltl]|uniref:Uncharacterized protein n=1 Tax=Pleurodeles waltl TaxID=8319 RepID=A0AAV7QAJ0_PLEWA|nr:hypothetical protein NDU88_001570 [Pleurodeles waltl]
MQDPRATGDLLETRRRPAGDPLETCRRPVVVLAERRTLRAEWEREQLKDRGEEGVKAGGPSTHQVNSAGEPTLGPRISRSICSRRLHRALLPPADQEGESGELGVPDMLGSGCSGACWIELSPAIATTTTTSLLPQT